MDFIKDSSFLIEVAKGNVKGHSLVSVVGRNQDVDTTITDIGMEDTIFTWLTVATTVEAISTNTNDTFLGTGARTITVHGLDANFDLIKEVIEMNGTTVSAVTTASFIRINKTIVETSGTYADTNGGTNLGDITIRPSGGGSTLSFIADVDIDPGASQDFKYTVPNGHTAIIIGVGANIDSTKTGRLLFNARAGADVITAPFTARKSSIHIAGLAGLHSVPQELLNDRIEAKTDLWASAIASANNTEIDITARILLIKD